MPKETVTFTVRWKEARSAQLVYVLDNGELVKTNIQSDTGQLAVTYEVETALTHVIEWSLLFPKETRTKLEATYQRQGGAPSPLDQEASQDNRWSSRGVA
jgi:hypothetical protein